MPAFAPFKTATTAATPSYIDAEIRRATIANQAKQAENARKSQNTMGGIALYNEAMGEKTPIQDYLSEILRSGDTTSAVPTAAADAASGTGDMATGADGINIGLDFSGGAEAGLGDYLSGVDTAGDMGAAADAASATDATGNVPVVSALKGAGELAAGDVGGAATTGLQSYLSTLGPYGLAAGLILGLLR